MRACKCDRCGEYYDEYKKDIDDLPEELIDPNKKCRGDYINGLVLEGYLDGADINNLTPCITVNIDGEKVGEAMKILKEGINLDWKPCCTSGEDDMQEHGCADS